MNFVFLTQSDRVEFVRALQGVSNILDVSMRTETGSGRLLVDVELSRAARVNPGFKQDVIRLANKFGGRES